MKESPMKFSYAVKASLPLVAALMLSSTAHAFNFGSLFGSKDPEANKAAVTAAAEAVAGVQQNTATTGSALTDGLVGALSEQLGISKTQAIGGLAALMGYASNNLPAEYGNQIKQMFPSMSSGTASGNLLGSLMGNFNSMESVDKTFDGLGMEAGMVDQFTPVIESYIGNSVGNPELVTALRELW
jgi:hypothetical protein